MLNEGIQNTTVFGFYSGCCYARCDQPRARSWKARRRRGAGPIAARRFPTVLGVAVDRKAVVRMNDLDHQRDSKAFYSRNCGTFLKEKRLIDQRQREQKKLAMRSSA